MDGALPEIDAAWTWLRLTGATSYLMIVTVAITLNTLMMIVLGMNSSKFGRVPFYLIIWQLAVSDLLAQISQMSIAVPITFVGYDLYGHSLTFHVLATLETVGYNGTLYFNFLLTLNRFLVFYWPCLDKMLFERPRIYVTVGFCWLYVACMVSAINVGGCHKDFSSTGFYYFHNCVDMNHWTFAIRQYVAFYSSTFLPFIILASHVLIFAKIHVDLKEARRMSLRGVHFVAGPSSLTAEKRFLLQSLCINGALQAQNLAFQTSQLIPPAGQWTYVINFVTNLTCVTNNMISPVTVFVFNREFRRALRLLCAAVHLQKTAPATFSRPSTVAVA